MQNTRKHTTLIRLGSFALLVLDAWTLSRFPSIQTAVFLWVPASCALILLTAPKESRFRL